MDATQLISNSILESDEEENEEENKDKRERPLAKLCILQNEHIPAAEFPLFLGDNVLGRDPSICTLPLPATSVSKRHATICISVYKRRGRHSGVDMEALVWDLGSLNGTRKGRLKLTPNVRYALSEGDSLVVADIPCQYVSCAVNTEASQGDTKTPVSRNSGVKAGLPDASREKGGDTSTGSKRCVNGGTKPSAMLPQLDQEDTRKTPARITCLSFEQTPTQPQGTLVPESDSDSDGETGLQGEGKCKLQVLDSDKSSPTCSTFLSPTNKIVPESEDESPITPSSFTKNRPYRHVSFSKEEPDIDVGRQQLKKKATLAIMDDSEEEEGREGERATPGGTIEESGQDVLVKQENNVSLTREEESLVSTRAVTTDVIPAFNMDSDTDVEGEEESVASAAPVTLSANEQADQPTNTVQFHMDSDTDVDEDEDMFAEGPKSVPFSDDNTKPPPAVAVIQPEGITMDSDTDVDDDADMSDAAAKAKPTCSPSAHTADSAPSKQPKDFHLDSDTDVDEEEGNECGTNHTCSEIDEAPTRIDIKATGSESAPAAPQSLHPDSETDDEVIPDAAISEPGPVSAVTISCTTADAGADNSDTDVEEDSPLGIPVAVTTLSVTPGIALAAAQSDSDADTDLDESSVPPAGDGDNPAELGQDSDTDVEDKEVDLGEAGEDQIPSLRREITPGFTVPLLQNCSTPVQISEGEVEEMETQAFLSPSLGPFRRAVAPAVRPVVLSSSSDSQEDENFVVPETQSFILQTHNDQDMEPTQAFALEPFGGERDGQSSRAGSFQMRLSDSSHLQCEAHALATENTQAFASVDVNNHDSHAFAGISTVGTTSVENDQNMEATQAYGGDEEPARSPVTFEKEGQVDFALEATQAYISKPSSDSEDEMEEDEGKNLTTAETQPLDFPASYALAMAETQPVCAFREEESLATGSHISSKTEAVDEHGEAAPPEESPLSGALSIAETQPMCTSEDEDLIPAPRKRKAKQLEEETQPFTSSDSSIGETQPMATSGNEESDDEDSIPFPWKRKAKKLRLDDEETQTPVNSELSVAETQPMHAGVEETQPMATSGNEESDDEDSIPFPWKRKAKKLRLDDEETQTPVNSELSVAETQPMSMCDDEESDDEDSIPGPRQKRKAKPLQLEEEQTQPLTSSVIPSYETEAVVTGEDVEEDDDDDESIVGQRKRKAKPLQLEEEETQSLTNSEASTVESQPVRTEAGPRPQRGEGGPSEAGTSGISVRRTRGTRARLREEEKQSESSEPHRRQTRGNKAFPTTRGRRQKSSPDGSEEEEEVEQAKQTRRKRSTRRQKDDEEEEERLELERNEQQEEGMLGEEKDLTELRQQEREETEKERRKIDERVRLDIEKREREETERQQCKEQERIERERKDKEEQERLQAEKAERLRLEQERVEKERKEQERREEEEKERADRIQREREQQLERERKERLEQEKAEREERERLEKEERERIEKEKRERIEKEERERLVKEERERIEKKERERLVKEERERIEKKERERLVKEERERIEKKKRERIEKKERERLVKEERERIEKEERERIEKERLEKERKEQEEREKLEMAKRAVEEQEKLEREREKQEHQARLEMEAKEREEREKLEKEKEAEEKQTAKAPARGRRAARRTMADPGTTEQDSTISANDDIPAMRTRSRSNSSNSVSSERSTSSVSTQGSRDRGRGRGRGRGAKRTSEPAPATVPRGNNNRRRTVAAEPSDQRETTEQDSIDVSSQGIPPSTSNPIISEISTCSISSQNRGRGGKQRGRGRKTEPDSNPPISSQSDQNSAPKPTARGKQSRKGEVSSNEVSHEDDKKKADSQQASTTRGRGRASVNGPADTEGKSSREEGSAGEPSLLPEGNVRDRGQKAVKSESVVAPAVSDGGETKDKRKGREKKLEVNAEAAQTAGEAAKDASQAKRRGRASGAQGSKNAKESRPEATVEDESEAMEEEIVVRRARGRPSGVQKKKEEVQEESGKCVNPINQDANMKFELPQTPTSKVSRKRQAPADSPPVAKTPRSSSASPAAAARVQAASQAYKVLFTGVEGEASERVLARLRGSMAKGVADMNCLVTDKVRRTVKFLCAVAKGVPIVTTHWLEKSGKAGSLLSPNAFIVKDPEQEIKFNFCLQESLRVASSQPLLQGYEIHVTKSVKPEPVQMKDIISCSGATFLPKMPSSHKPQTVVISCEEDARLCGPAVSASLPVVTAEFILTGILQQKLDFETHKLAVSTTSLQPAGGRGRGRKKT